MIAKLFLMICVIGFLAGLFYYLSKLLTKLYFFIRREQDEDYAAKKLATKELKDATADLMDAEVRLKKAVETTKEIN